MQKAEESNNIKIEIGSVVKSKEGLFRILVMNEKTVILIQLEIEKLNVIRISMDFFKYEVANEIGVNLKQGYNGDLTSKQAGSVGGEMVKRLVANAANQMQSQQPNQ